MGIYSHVEAHFPSELHFGNQTTTGALRAWHWNLEPTVPVLAQNVSPSKKHLMLPTHS